MTVTMPILEALDMATYLLRQKYKALAMGLVKRQIKSALQEMWMRQKQLVLLELENHRHLFKIKEAAGDPVPDGSTPGDPAVPNFGNALDSVAPDANAAMASAMAQSYDAGGATAAADPSVAMPKNFSLANNLAQQWAQNHAGDLSRGVNETTNKQLHNTLVQGITDGWGFDKTSEEVNALFDSYGSKRGELIAMNEMSTAYSQGMNASISALIDSGLTYEKSWEGGPVSCQPICMPNIEMGWIPFDEHFPSGDEMTPAHPGCDCDTAYRRVGDSSAGVGQELSVDEQAAFEYFVGPEGQILDTLLRDANSILSPEQLQIVKHMDTALARNSVVQEQVVLRKLSGFSNHALIGNTIVDKSFPIFKAAPKEMWTAPPHVPHTPTPPPAPNVPKSFPPGTIQPGEKLSAQQIYTAIQAGNNSLGDIAKYWGISGTPDTLSSGLSNTIQKMLKNSDLSLVVKGTKYYYGLPGFPPKIEGAVAKDAVVKLKVGQKAVTINGQTILPRGTALKPVKFGKDNINLEVIKNDLHPPFLSLPTEQDLARMEKISGPLGAQGGQWYHDPLTGQTFFVKPVPMGMEHAQNELATNLAYKIAGLGSKDPVTIDIALLKTDAPVREPMDVFINNSGVATVNFTSRLTKEEMAAIQNEISSYGTQYVTRVDLNIRDFSGNIKWTASYNRQDFQYGIAARLRQANENLPAPPAPQLITVKHENLRALDRTNPVEIKQAQVLFGVDALLSNWDVVGAGGTDNMLYDGVTHSVVRLDAGGGMAFGGLGGVKPGFNENTVWKDWETLRTNINPSAQSVFGSMTKKEVAESLQYAAQHLDLAKLETAWLNAGINPTTYQPWLNTLKYRKDEIPKIINKLLGVKGPTPDAWSLTNWQTWKDRLSPTQIKAGQYWISHHYTQIQESDVELQIWFEALLHGKLPSTAKTFDGMFKTSRTSEQMFLFRGLNQDPADKGGALIGREFSYKGYSATSYNTNQFGGSWRMVINAPAGTPALFLEALSGQGHVGEGMQYSEREILLNRNQVFRITNVIDSPDYRVTQYGGTIGLRTYFVDIVPADHSAIPEISLTREQLTVAKIDPDKYFAPPGTFSAGSNPNPVRDIGSLIDPTSGKINTNYVPKQDVPSIEPTHTAYMKYVTDQTMSGQPYSSFTSWSVLAKENPALLPTQEYYTYAKDALKTDGVAMDFAKWQTIAAKYADPTVSELAQYEHYLQFVNSDPFMTLTKWQAEILPKEPKPFWDEYTVYVNNQHALGANPTSYEIWTQLNKMPNATVKPVSQMTDWEAKDAYTKYYLNAPTTSPFSFDQWSAMQLKYEKYVAHELAFPGTDASMVETFDQYVASLNLKAKYESPLISMQLFSQMDSTQVKDAWNTYYLSHANPMTQGKWLDMQYNYENFVKSELSLGVAPSNVASFDTYIKMYDTK